MSWGSKPVEWPEAEMKKLIGKEPIWPTENAGKAFKDVWDGLKKTNEEILAITGVDKLPKTGTEINAIFQADQAIARVRNNLKPTHDPYKNPNAHIYYQCGCGAIFDPGTKRFAELNHKASEAGWKVRWGSNGYVPYCVDCGKDVE